MAFCLVKHRDYFTLPYLLHMGYEICQFWFFGEVSNELCTTFLLFCFPLCAELIKNVRTTLKSGRYNNHKVATVWYSTLIRSSNLKRLSSPCYSEVTAAVFHLQD